MKLETKTSNDIEDIEKCINEIIFYLLFNSLDIRGSININSINRRYSTEFKDVNTYINFISRKIEDDLEKIKIYYNEDEDDEYEANIEIMSNLISTFSNCIPIIDSLHYDNRNEIENIIGKHISWELNEN